MNKFRYLNEVAEDGSADVIAQVEDPATSEEASSEFEDMALELEQGEIEETTVVEETEETTEEVSEEVTGEGETEAVTEEVTEEPETTQVEEETPQETVEEVAQQTPEEIAAQQEAYDEQYTANRNNLVESLEKNLYSLSEEDAERLITEPEKVLPQIAAKLHVEVLEAATQGILASLPNVIRQVQNQTVVQEKVVDDFYSQWPGLKEHHAEVEKVAVIYKQLNPNKVGAELAQGIGTYASAMLGVEIPGVATEQTAPPVQTTPPPAPAGRGTTRSAAPTPTETNVFTEMADLVDEFG